MEQSPSQHSKKATRQGGARRRRVPQISNWLAFIQRYLRRYTALPRGEQRRLIDQLSEKTGASENTLRRYIAAARALEANGITKFPAGVKYLPVAAVEAIERIGKQDPGRGRELFKQLIAGGPSVRGLKEELADVPKRGSAPHRAAAKRISPQQVLGAIASRFHVRESELSLIRFIEAPMERTFNLFAKAAAPRLVVLATERRRAAIFDVGVLSWAASPAIVTREFLRNIAVATTMFDCVVVLGGTLSREVEEIVGEMRKDCRDRVLVLSGVLDLDL
jgi:hypothetical protein